MKNMSDGWLKALSPAETDVIINDIKTRFTDGFPAIIGVPDSWLPLIVKLHQDIVKIDPEYTIQQIKIKFGGLRYYIQTSPTLSEDNRDRCRKLIYDAEEKSYEL